jgi:sulfate adenylyltransferase
MREPLPEPGTLGVRGCPSWPADGYDAGMPNDNPPAVVLTAADARRLQLLAAGVFAPVLAPMDAQQAEAVRTSGTLPDGTPWSTPLECLVEAPADAAACVLKDGEGRTLGRAQLDPRTATGGLRRVLGLPAGLRPAPALADQLAEVAALAGHGAVHAYVVEDCLHRADVAHLARLLPAGAPLLLLRLTGCADEPCHLLHATGLANRQALVHLAAVRSMPGSDAPGAQVAVLDLPRFDLEHPASAPMLARIAANLGAVALLAKAPLAGAADSAPASLHRRVVQALIRRDAAVDALTWPDVAATLRAAHLPAGRRGFTVLLTGLSGAGKSTIAQLLSSTLMTRTLRPVSLLDGDLVRQHLSRGLGFGRADREANLMRIAFVAREVTRHGGIAICAPIAPYTAIRSRIRDWIAEVGEFVEVHVATPIDVCEQRDPKGLYALARAGELRGFTGIDDPYEPPEHPELRLDTSRLALADSVERICDYLLAEGLIRMKDDG